MLIGPDGGKSAGRSRGKSRPGQGASRREAILTEAAALFAAQGVAATTVRQIAEEAGMLSGSLYHHFASKEVMVQEIVISYLEDLLARYRSLDTRSADPVSRLRQLVQVSIETGVDHPHAVEVYQNEGVLLGTVPRSHEVALMAAEVHQLWADNIRAGVDDLQFRSDVSARLFHRLIRDAVWLSPRWYHPSEAYPPSRFAEHVVSVFLDGFTAG